MYVKCFSFHSLIWDFACAVLVSTCTCIILLQTCFCGFERLGVMKWEESIRPCHVPASLCAFERMRQSDWAEPAGINEALISLLVWCPLVRIACACHMPDDFFPPTSYSKWGPVDKWSINKNCFCFSLDLCIYWFICNKRWSAVTSFVVISLTQLTVNALSAW